MNRSTGRKMPRLTLSENCWLSSSVVMGASTRTPRTGMPRSRVTTKLIATQANVVVLMATAKLAGRGRAGQRRCGPLLRGPYARKLVGGRSSRLPPTGASRLQARPDQQGLWARDKLGRSIGQPDDDTLLPETPGQGYRCGSRGRYQAGQRITWRSE